MSNRHTQRNYLIIFFGLCEIIIGFVTLIAVIISLLLGQCAKPPAVLIFVFASAILSSVLGIGILRYHLSSYNLLIFFAKVIILSKILVLTKIITLNGALETVIPAPVKSLCSILYHSLLVWYFSRPGIRRHFTEG